MTYIGEEEGIKGYCFICASGTIFLGAMATFDETIFPHCHGASTPGSTNFGNLPPQDQEDHNHSDGMDIDDDDMDKPSEHSVHDGAADAPPDLPLVSPQDFAPQREDQQEWHDLPAQ